MEGNRYVGRNLYEKIDITNSRAHVGDNIGPIGDTHTHAHFHQMTDAYTRYAYGELYDRASPLRALPGLEETLAYNLLRNRALQLENSFLRDHGSIGNRERPVGTAHPSLARYHPEPWANPRSNDPYVQNVPQYYHSPHQHILNSLPQYQFDDQVYQEKKRISASETSIDPSDLHTKATENVERAWKKIGIWNDRWSDTGVRGRWKHEEPLVPVERKPGRRKSRSQIAAQRAKFEKDRDASRPINQFKDQLSKEVSAVLKSGRENDINDPKINTRVGEIVKQSWVRRGVWDEAWGELPGMMWKHERDPIVDEYIRREENQSGRGDEANTEHLKTPLPNNGFAPSFQNTNPSNSAIPLSIGNPPSHTTSTRETTDRKGGW